jgi:hypothetical protein
MSSAVRIVSKPIPDITSEQARDARARAWSFIFDTYRKKAARQDNAKTRQKSLNTEEGGPHDQVEDDIFVRQKV